MARQKKREDKRYQKNFRYDGKQYCVYGSTATEAEENKAKKLAELKRGEEKRSNPTLNEFYKNTFSVYQSGKVKDGTIRSQGASFKACASIIINDNGKKLGELKIADIRRDDILRVQKELAKSDRKTSTVNKFMTDLSHVFKEAVNHDIITKNPCANIAKIHGSEPQARETKHRALSQEETQAFFDGAKESYYYNVFRMLIQTGMRVGELGALKNSDIDLKNNCIHIKRTVTVGELGNFVIGTDTKTFAGTRDIPLTDTIKEILADQKRLMRLIHGNVIDFDSTIFKSAEGHLLLDYPCNREIKRITKRCGIDDFTCHAFRATFATRFIEQRPGDFKILSEILGHKNINITLDLYTHCMKENKQNAMNNIVIAM